MRRYRRGGALLAVLWLSAVLAAIALSVANTVRGETERTSTAAEGVRTHYLAAGAMERAIFYMLMGPGERLPDGSARFAEMGTPRLHFQFPSGAATVEIIPESSKFNLNSVPPEELLRLLLHLQVQPDQANEIAAAIVDWRTPMPMGILTPFDHYYLRRTPTFPSRHASLEEIEELLLVKGMTPEIFYGAHTRDAEGRLYPLPGLRDCVTIFGTPGAMDVNTVQPAVMAAVGINPAAIAAIVQRRHAVPFRDTGQLAPLAPIGGPAMSRLTIGGNTISTLRATARLRRPDGSLSDLSRTISGVIKVHKPGYSPRVEFLRWYEN